MFFEAIVYNRISLIKLQKWQNGVELNSATWWANGVWHISFLFEEAASKRVAHRHTSEKGPVDL